MSALLCIIIIICVLIVLWLIFFGCTDKLSEHLTPVNNWLDDHNKTREDVNQQPVNWNDIIANGAEAYALKCKFEHSSNNDRMYNGRLLGENLVMGSPYGSWPDQKLFALWESEKQYYNHPQYPDMQNGHYTQIVNKNVTDIGCGCAQCNNSKLCVCRYNPIQMANQYPY